MASRSIDLISKQTNLHVQHAFCLTLLLSCTTTKLFCRTRTSNVLVTHYFYRGIVASAYPILSPVFMIAFIFHCRSFSPCWPLAFLIVLPPLWIFMFFSLHNSSLLFLITRSSSFSVIHVSVNIKNNVEKDTNLLLFFLSKSPGANAIFFQIKPWLAFGLPYLLIELFNIGMHVVQTDGRSGGRSVYGHVITKFSRMGSIPHFLTHGAPLRASRARAPLWCTLHDHHKKAALWQMGCLYYGYWVK